MEKVEYNDAAAPAVTPKRVAPKKRSAMSIFRAAAFFAMGGCSPSYSPRKKNIGLASPGGADAVLKNLVGGMRPLGHLQLHGQYDDTPVPAPRRGPAPASASAAFPLLPPPPPESFYDVLLPPASPAYSSEDCMSRYASAEDLQALDTTEGGEAAADSAPGDGAIDVKAEEFIANFYEQMKLQRSDSVYAVDQEPKSEQAAA